MPSHILVPGLTNTSHNSYPKLLLEVLLHCSDSLHTYDTAMHACKHIFLLQVLMIAQEEAFNSTTELYTSHVVLVL